MSYPLRRSRPEMPTARQPSAAGFFVTAEQLCDLQTGLEEIQATLKEMRRLIYGPGAEIPQKRRRRPDIDDLALLLKMHCLIKEAEAAGEKLSVLAAATQVAAAQRTHNQTETGTIRRLRRKYSATIEVEKAQVQGQPWAIKAISQYLRDRAG